jgi:hypothetical protein
MLDHRFSVAPMMDWTDLAGIAAYNQLLKHGRRRPCRIKCSTAPVDERVPPNECRFRRLPFLLVVA